MRISTIDPRHSPLTDAQAAQFNALVASLTEEQTPWLLGYLAGINQAQVDGHVAAAPASTSSDGEHLTVLFASQTGNAAKVAKQVSAAASAAGIQAVVVSAADLPPAKLRDTRDLVLISSTQGEGDPPDSAVELRRYLFGKRAPRLDRMRFAVLALGDCSYANFCKAGADFDRRLEELGAQRALARVDCDVDFQSAAESWQGRMIEAFGHLAHSSGRAAPMATATPSAQTAAIYDKVSPFAAPVLERIALNGRGSDKRTTHFELSLAGSGIRYQPGDALGVLPRNSPDYLGEVVAAAHLEPEARVSVDGQERTLVDALGEVYEITTITRPFLQAYAAETGHAELAELAQPGHEESFRRYAYGREIVDVLVAYPPSALSPQVFIGMLRRLQPRLYSIASSLLAHPGEVHLLVGLTRYQSHGRTRTGVCSGYLCERLGEDEPVRLYLSSNPAFRLPANPDARVVMIGPGTGVAPFRAFVEERAALGSRGRNWLFFGDRHFAADFLYQVEWQRWYKAGVLSRLDLAFSRDQAGKVYVQQRLLESAREVYAWLQDGAHVYVCGDASRMAAAVEETLVAIVRQEGGKAEDAAIEYVDGLRAEKRYLRDIY